MGAHYSITIPTKPYLKKYIESLYGKPVVFTQDNYFGMSLTGFLNRKFFVRHNESITHKRFDEFSAGLQLYFPRWWITQSHFGTDLPKMNIIYLNKTFEERLEEDLSRHCIILDLIGIQIKDSIEDFCKMHCIEIDEDITMDALKKKEYRFRKNKYSENFIAQLSRKKSRLIQQGLF